MTQYSRSITVTAESDLNGAISSSVKSILVTKALQNNRVSEVVAEMKCDFVNVDDNITRKNNNDDTNDEYFFDDILI